MVFLSSPVIVVRAVRQPRQYYSTVWLCTVANASPTMHGLDGMALLERDTLNGLIASLVKSFPIYLSDLRNSVLIQLLRTQ